MITNYEFSVTDGIFFSTIKNKTYIDPTTEFKYKVTGLTKVNGVTQVILENIDNPGKFHVVTSNEFSSLLSTI